MIESWGNVLALGLRLMGSKANKQERLVSVMVENKYKGIKAF